jgi:hypothetical protein
MYRYLNDIIKIDSINVIIIANYSGEGRILYIQDDARTNEITWKLYEMLRCYSFRDSIIQWDQLGTIILLT